MSKYVNPWENHLPKFSEDEYIEFEEIKDDSTIQDQRLEEIIEIEPEEISPTQRYLFDVDSILGSDFSIFSKGLFNNIKSKF